LKIFLAATSLHDSYGGPAYSVARLAAELVNLGNEVALWSANGSLPSLDTSCRVLSGPLGNALKDMGTPDVIHDNGLWMPHNHWIAKAATAARIARVVSSRGMLEPWALRHKPFKKGIAWRLYQERDLNSAARIHATSTTEAANIESLDLHVRTSVIPNGVDVPVVLRESARTETPSHRIALFLGRIYPVKGLPMLVRAWEATRPPGWILKIAGPDEAGHQEEVESIIRSCRLQEAIKFVGPADAEAKARLFREAELFILPTHSESFGMAIAESLAHAVPVLTTTSAPWPVLEKRNYGWRTPPTIDGLKEGLLRATQANAGDLREMGNRGRAFVELELNWRMVGTHFCELYSEVVR
jgi:glycosyltransferase involved in cell wall biosynthesis